MFETHILRAHMGHDDFLTSTELLENRVLPKVRVAVEGDFGHTSKLFKLTQTWSSIKLLKHHSHQYYYFTSTLLRNLHVCCYGSTTSSYFNCKPPSLEDYLS